MDKKIKLKIFEDAFRSGLGHSQCRCSCGKVFYNSNGGWDWDDGELEELEKNNATDLDYTVSTVFFEGKEYCLDCDCWHERALMICDFITYHNYKIIEFFKLLKKYKQYQADDIILMNEE